MIFLISAAAATAAALASAGADTPDVSKIDIREMYFMHGTCTRLVLPEGDRTAVCNQAVGHVRYGSGRTSFWFSIPNKVLLSFSGPGEANDGEHATLEVDLVTAATSPETPLGHAQGRCSLDNPWKGASHIRCQARNEQGEYIAEFTTDGKQPDKIVGD